MLGKTTPEAARRRGGGGAAWFSAGLRQALRETRRERGRVAPGEMETHVFSSPKTPTIYRGRGGGCAPSRVPTPRGAAALDGMEGGRPRGGERGAP